MKIDGGNMAPSNSKSSTANSNKRPKIKGELAPYIMQRLFGVLGNSSVIRLLSVLKAQNRLRSSTTILSEMRREGYRM